MPTSLRRTHLTHTPPVAGALHTARQRWPEVTTESGLLARILAEWDEHARIDTAATVAADRAAIRGVLGKYQGRHSRAILEEMRAEWPA